MLIRHLFSLLIVKFMPAAVYLIVRVSKISFKLSDAVLQVY